MRQSILISLAVLLVLIVTFSWGPDNPLFKEKLESSPFLMITEAGYIAKGYTHDGQCVYWGVETPITYQTLPDIQMEVVEVRIQLYHTRYDELEEGHVFVKCETVEN